MSRIVLPDSTSDQLYDTLVIGGGPGGYATALRAAARGARCAVIEQDRVGGTCLNRGCIPSKAILYVSEVLEQIGRSAELGIDVALGGISGDRLDAFRSSVMDRLRSGLRGLIEKQCTLVSGRGTIVEGRGPVKRVGVTTTDGGSFEIRGRHVVLATGSTVRSLPHVPIDGGVVQSSDEALWFRQPPARAVIIGGGAIGMEFASMWAPMGTHITLVEAFDRVLPMEDPLSSSTIERLYRKKGIDVRTSATVKEVAVSGGTATIAIEAGGSVVTVPADVVLVATGRSPNSAGTGADELGILDDRGYVVTDELGHTQIEGVWAVGDVRPTLALAHAAFAEGFVVADVVTGRERVRSVDHALIPRVTYCHPEVASVGLTEPQARERFGDAVSTSTYSLGGNAKALIAGSDGFVKVIFRTDDPGETVGVHIVGPHATDLIAEATLATAWGALPAEVASITHPHPTLAESIGEAFLAASGTPFHSHR